jgi:signal transduction histidine kinase
MNTIKSYIYSIFYNLLSNAVNYRSDKRALHVDFKSSVEQDIVCIKVTDNGSGIDLERYGDKIFGLYKRFHDVSIPGRGVGLSLVKAQIESMGGKIEVLSVVDSGTTFFIYLPKFVR